MKTMQRNNLSLIPTFYCLVACFFLSACSQLRPRKDHTGEIGIAVAALLVNEFCGAVVPTTSLYRITEETMVKENRFCENPERFQFNERIFSSALSSDLESKSMQVPSKLIYSDKSFDIVINRKVFNTASAVSIDKKGHLENGNLYNYSEFRAGYFGIDGIFSGISANSETSISDAYSKAVENCKGRQIN